MTRSDAQRIGDILDACRKLGEVAALGRAEYDRSWIVQSAVERQLEVIGEAAGHLSEEFLAANAELPIRQAKGLRNVLAHEYFSVNHDRVWNVVASRVPQLVSALSAHAAQTADPGLEQSKRELG